MIRAALVLLFFALYVPPASVIGLLVARLTGRVAILYRLGRAGVRAALVIGGTRVVAEGLEQLADPRHTVVMSNHVSHLDAPVLFQVLGVDFKAVAKKEVFAAPFFGAVLRMAGFIEVDRGNREQARQAMDRTAASLRQGACFLIFPEGTRSRTGELGEFKKGAFVAAVESGSRILPVALSGTRELMPKGRFAIRPGTVRVRVLDSVDTRSYSYADRDRLIAEVKGRIAEALAVAAAPAAPRGSEVH
jgi:1-acyl-sn-glycerol-3-phosphate acyltransferase